MKQDKLVEACAGALTYTTEDTAADDKKFAKLHKAHKAKRAKLDDEYNAISGEIRDLKAGLKPAIKKLTDKQKANTKEGLKDIKDFKLVAAKLGYEFQIPGGYQRVK